MSNPSSLFVVDLYRTSTSKRGIKICYKTGDSKSLVHGSILTASKACYVLSEHDQKWEDGAEAVGEQMEESSMMASGGLYDDNDSSGLCGSA